MILKATLKRELFISPLARAIDAYILAAMP